MKRALYIFYLAVLFGVTVSVDGCTDSNAVIDNNTAITGHNWSYVNRIRNDVKIEDTKAAYNLYFNLRVTGDYKYSNIFLLVYQASAGNKPKVTRYEIKLASRDGEWLGKGSGNLYSYQVPFRTGYHFPAAGVYQIAIEQNMRDNPLHEVSDVGLRVEKAE